MAVGSSNQLPCRWVGCLSDPTVVLSFWIDFLGYHDGKREHTSGAVTRLGGMMSRTPAVTPDANLPRSCLFVTM
jgi:hypothetical protein